LMKIGGRFGSLTCPSKSHQGSTAEAYPRYFKDYL
jgi:hypothetical protein